ncbi:MAG: hypothetical protein ACI80S_000911, partial [Pseudohongiellaceae bacterium]
VLSSPILLICKRRFLPTPILLRITDQGSDTSVIDQ